MGDIQLSNLYWLNFHNEAFAAVANVQQSIIIKKKKEEEKIENLTWLI